VIPKTILIGGLRYTVEECEDLHALDGEKCDGLLNVDTWVIKLEARLPEAAREQVLWHEIIHATLNQMGRPDQYKDEPLVDALAFCVVSVLQSNPQYTHYRDPQLVYNWS